MNLLDNYKKSEFGEYQQAFMNGDKYYKPIRSVITLDGMCYSKRFVFINLY